MTTARTPLPWFPAVGIALVWACEAAAAMPW
jgi:hypothetical protein